MEKLTGIHAVREALAARRPVQSVVIAKRRHGDRLEEIVHLARANGVPVRFEERPQVDRTAGTRDHQGVVAFLASKATESLEDLLAAGGAKQARLLVLLDGIEDPHNLGAIIRTSLAAGTGGVVIPERRAAGLTDAAVRASAGAAAHLPVARVTNLARAIEQIKQAGYWIVGLDERAEKCYTDIDLTGAIALVLGGEGQGLHQLVKKLCDFVVSIPTQGAVRSLNVSVAAGVVLFEVVRQRAAKGAAQVG